MLKRNSSLNTAYPESEICGFSRYDSTVHFYSRVGAAIRTLDLNYDGRFLDVGCGLGLWGVRSARNDHKAWQRRCMTIWGTVIGIDVDPDCAANGEIDQFDLIEPDGTWPIENDSIDLAISDYVLEHVEDPVMFFAELRRVLKPGGIFCLRTPNKWFWVCVAARIIPNKDHHKFVDRDPSEVYPTVYRANTARRLRSLMRGAGLSGTVYSWEQEPSYLGRWPWLYHPMSYVHRWLPPWFQSTLVCFGRK